MSRNYNKSSSAKPKFYCKVCFDNNRSIKEYTSHNVRTEKGTTCCPILLAINCGYCGINGHSPKYCPRLAKDKKREEHAAAAATTKVKEQKSVKPEETKKSTAIPQGRSKFSVLEFSSSDSEEETASSSKPAPWAASAAPPRKLKWTDENDSEEDDD